MSEDDDLTDLLGSFMDRLRAYLVNGGPDDVIDRIIAAGTVAAAALMILWSPNRKAKGLFGVIGAIGRQIWSHRRWYGIPGPPDKPPSR